MFNVRCSFFSESLVAWETFFVTVMNPAQLLVILKLER